MIRSAIRPLLVGLAALALSGCGAEDVTRKFGVTRNGPEDQRVAQPPLSVPPLLTQRPPRAGGPPVDELVATSPAPQEGDREGTLTPGQDALLTAAGPSAPSNIRQRVEQDAQIRHQDQAF